MGHTLSDHRHGLIASAVVTQADGFAERETAKTMNVVPHMAQNKSTTDPQNAARTLPDCTI